MNDHFEKSSPEVWAAYQAILEAARCLGPVHEDPKKTSIHLVRDTAFAGVAARRDALILTLKSDRPLKSKRVRRSEQTSAGRWHHEVRIAKPADVDRELKDWLAAAYELSGTKRK
jgi:hypothetical protein